MEDLRAWYLGTLSVAISNFTAARRELAQGAPSAAERIRESAHPLRGSGGTYGFPAISVAAAAVEEADDDHLLACLDNLISTMESVVAGSGSGPIAASASVPGSETTVSDSETTVSETTVEDSLDTPAADVILVIEDDSSVANLLQSELGGVSREVLVAGTALEAREIIGKRKISLITLDLVLPDGDGRTLLMSLRSRPATASVPIIVLTVRGGAEIEAECLTLGADAFFEKPFDPAPFRLAVNESLQRVPAGENSVQRDRRTGLPNRVALQEAFTENAPEREAGVTASLALIDLDRFRAVSDTCGAQTGDKVLAHVASTLGVAMRAGDMLARWHGDRFAVLFSGTDLEAAREILSGARAMAHRTPYIRQRGGVVDVTFSAGIVAVRQGESLEEALRRADHFLYLAKASGRDRIVADEDDVSVPHRTVLLAEDDEATARIIRERLRREGFDVLHRENGAAALEAARGASVDLFLLDVRMPVMDGFALLEALRSEPRFATTPIVMLTSLGSEESVVRAHDLGASDYIVKPADPDEVVARIQKLLGRWVTGRLDDLVGSELYAAALESLEQAFDAVRSGKALSVEGPGEVADRLIEALRADGADLLGQVAVPDPGDDHSTLRHSLNVAILGVCVGSEMRLTDDNLRALCLAGLLHEIGCLRLPEDLLQKAGALSASEEEEIRRQPQYAHEALAQLGAPYELVAEAAWQINERLDGSGYPRGLSDETVSPEARILGAVDAYETWTHMCPHRPDCVSAKEALERLLARAPGQFARSVVKAMIDRLGIFPVGTCVEFRTGEIGQVMESRHDNPMRPLVAVMRDPRGRAMPVPRIVDLKMSTQNAIKGPAPFPCE